MKTYIAGVDATSATVTDEELKATPLDPRYDIINHSPDGFAWGYGGSGPAQLAIAILADHLGDDNKAVMLYQQFKWAKIAVYPRDEEFIMTSDQIDRWLEGLERELRAKL